MDTMIIIVAPSIHYDPRGLDQHRIGGDFVADVGIDFDGQACPEPVEAAWASALACAPTKAAKIKST